MHRLSRRITLFFVGVFLISTALSAQESVSELSGGFSGLASLIPNLFDRTVVLFPAGHQAHFVDSSQVLRGAGIQINSSLVGQLSTFPLGSSSGGFTHTFNEDLGIFERTSESFGSVFAERGETIGKGRWNFGFNFFSVSYDSLDDFDLRDGELEFSLTHVDVNNDGGTVETFFEGDLILASASLAVDTETFVLFFTYGVSSRFDLAVAVPLVRVDLDAQLDLRINRNASEGFSSPPLHRFLDGRDDSAVLARGSASGVGDILLRGKYNLARNEFSSLALGVDVRLPTGDEEDLLGTGTTQSKVFLIGSTTIGRVSPHVNVGYTFSSGRSELIGELPDEINFTTGVSVSLHPRVTFSVDAVWRTLLDANQLERSDEPFLFKRFDSTQVETITRPQIGTEVEDINLLLGAVGLRINVAGDVLVTVNLAFSLSDEGLRDDGIIPLIGLDYSF